MCSRFYIVQYYSTALRQSALCSTWYSLTDQLRDSRFHASYVRVFSTAQRQYDFAWSYSIAKKEYNFAWFCMYCTVKLREITIFYGHTVQLRDNAILYGPTVQFRDNAILYSTGTAVQLRE